MIMISKNAIGIYEGGGGRIAAGDGLFAGGPFAAGLIAGGLFASGLNAAPHDGPRGKQIRIHRHTSTIKTYNLNQPPVS